MFVLCTAEEYKEGGGGEEGDEEGKEGDKGEGEEEISLLKHLSLQRSLLLQIKQLNFRRKNSQ